MIQKFHAAFIRATKHSQWYKSVFFFDFLQSLFFTLYNPELSNCFTSCFLFVSRFYRLHKYLCFYSRLCCHCRNSKSLDKWLFIISISSSYLQGSAKLMARLQVPLHRQFYDSRNPTSFHLRTLASHVFLSQYFCPQFEFQTFQIKTSTIKTKDLLNNNESVFFESGCNLVGCFLEFLVLFSFSYSVTFWKYRENFCNWLI